MVGEEAGGQNEWRRSLPEPEIVERSFGVLLRRDKTRQSVNQSNARSTN